MLKKKKVSLALSSGSARGWAHIGAIEAIIDAGYEISAISGSSSGAVIAAFYADGKLDMLKEFAYDLDKKKSFNLFDFNLIPKTGLINGNKIINRLKEMLSSQKIEEIQIPLYICITSLESGSSIFLSKGSLIDALRASIAVPGIFEPHKIKGSYYIDGAVSTPLPAHILIQNNHSNVISIDLNNHIKEPSITSMPNILYTLYRAINIVSKHATCDSTFINESWKIIKPDLSSFGPFDYHRAKELIKYGYKATKEQL